MTSWASSAEIKVLANDSAELSVADAKNTLGLGFPSMSMDRNTLFRK